MRFTCRMFPTMGASTNCTPSIAKLPVVKSRGSPWATVERSPSSTEVPVPIAPSKALMGVMPKTSKLIPTLGKVMCPAVSIVPR